jgi:hypothetical protein
VREWRIRTPVGEYKPLEVIRFVFYPENLLMLCLFSVMFWIACVWSSLPYGMGLRSAPFWFLCITLFFNYSFVVVDYTARGVKSLPKISGEMVFPSSDLRLYTFAFLTLSFAAFVFGGWESTDQSSRLMLAFFLYPLMLSVLIVSQRLSGLLNPVSLIKRLLIFVSSIRSFNFFALQFGVGWLLYWEIQSFGKIPIAHLIWQVPLTLVLLLVLFRLLGVVLNQLGPKLGLVILTNEAMHREAEIVEAGLVLDDFVQSLYRWVRVHEYGNAWREVDQFRKDNRHALDDALYVRLLALEDSRLAMMLGTQIAETRLKHGDVMGGLRIFRDCFLMNPDRFSFSSGGSALDFLDAGSDLASRQLLLRYMLNFTAHFPAYPQLSRALSKAIGVAINAREHTIAIKLLDEQVALFPEMEADSLYQRQRLSLEGGAAV